MFVSGNKYPGGKGRRIVVSTDLVTGAMNGFKNTQVDSFNLGNIIKGAGKLAAATGIPIVSQAGNTAANLVENKQSKKSSVISNVGTLGDWEQRVIRDKSTGNTYFVNNGKAVPYPIGSIAPDGMKYDWGSVQDLAKLPSSGTGTVTKVTSVTPMISPLPPSVPTTPGDANILAATKASNLSMADKIVQQVESMTPEQRQAILSKAQGIFDSGSNGVLSKAQKALQNATLGILPKTKAVKDAEAILTAPQHDGEGSKISFSSPWVIGGIITVIVGIIVLVVLKK